MSDPAQPDIFTLLTRRDWGPPQAARPPISVTGSQLIGRRPDQAAAMVRTIDGEELRLDVGPFIARDPHPIPSVADRETYCSNDDAGFWMSGLRDYLKVKTAIERHGRTGTRPGPLRFLDFGCASGRVLRHVACQEEGVEAWGCDLSHNNIEWILKHLPRKIRVFRNTVYPHLPIPGNTFDAICAFSVFTHIDAFEDLWLLELRRILRPGGVACVTFHSERSWLRVRHEKHAGVLADMLKCRAETPGIELSAELFERPQPFDRVVLSWPGDDTYRRNVFQSIQYVEERWGRWFEVCRIYDGGVEGLQDLVVLRRE